jgi:DNA polymerase III subunit delta'
MTSALAEIRGQALAVDLLDRALGEDRLAGAYLFAGPDGVGKARTAEALVAALLCESRPPCAVCDRCRKRAAGVHPDRIEIRLPDDKKEIPVGAIRELQARLVYPPHEGLRRAILIHDAECLSVSAANALLKTPEEPPSRTHFILTSSAPHALLPTIRSRCQLVRFAPLSSADLTAICLAAGASPEAATVAAALAGGSASRALAALEQQELEAQRARAEAFDRAACGTLAEAMAAAQEVSGDKGGALLRTFELLEVYHRDLLLACEEMDDDRLGLLDRRTEVRARAGRTTARTVLGRLAVLQEAQERLDGNANPTLVAEWVALRFRELPVPAVP